jgi:hypothetical protein
VQARSENNGAVAPPPPRMCRPEPRTQRIPRGGGGAAAPLFPVRDVRDYGFPSGTYGTTLPNQKQETWNLKLYSLTFQLFNLPTFQLFNF